LTPRNNIGTHGVNPKDAIIWGRGRGFGKGGKTKPPQPAKGKLRVSNAGEHVRQAGGGGVDVGNWLRPRKGDFGKKRRRMRAQER